MYLLDTFYIGQPIFKCYFKFIFNCY